MQVVSFVVGILVPIRQKDISELYSLPTKKTGIVVFTKVTDSWRTMSLRLEQVLLLPKVYVAVLDWSSVALHI